MNDYRKVANPGSAIGEAIGASMEKALERILIDVADSHGCYYLTSGVRKTKAGNKAKKLLLSDNYGNEYDIDGVLANESMQPLIIFESKYIRYKKHNRDKGSWVCTAHSAIRRRYHSIRSSIAVLAGSWSGSSQAMMKSNDINLFLVPFEYICELLSDVNIDFNWGEKEKEKAFDAWNRYNHLTQEEKDNIGRRMIGSIKNRLIPLIEAILDDSIEREVEKIVVEIVSNLGEVKVYEFTAIIDALEFLEQEDLKELFLTTNSSTLFDPPPEFDE
jgi:hypothetical protein